MSLETVQHKRVCSVDNSASLRRCLNIWATFVGFVLVLLTLMAVEIVADSWPSTLG